MEYREEVRDLFTLPKEYLLVNGVSADYALNGGLAKRFAHDYNMRYCLRALGEKNDWREEGRCVIINLNDDLEQTHADLATVRVANLIFKAKFWQKPTYKNVIESLDDLKVQLVKNYPMVKKIAIPQKGIGWDRLAWRELSVIIALRLKDWDGECLICMTE